MSKLALARTIARMGANTVRRAVVLVVFEVLRDASRPTSVTPARIVYHRTPSR